MRVLNEIVAENIWRPDKYEHGYEPITLEILVGDGLLLSYIYAKNNLKNIVYNLRYQEMSRSK